ncbi:MAG: cytochrome b/b6 domain-containing protein, partial [Pseudomonadota bacterium]
MALANTADRYGSLSKTFHWLTALLILTLMPLGIVANDMAYQIRTGAETADAFITRTAWLFSLHKTLGVAVFFVALLRILWALSQPKPGLLHRFGRQTFQLAVGVQQARLGLAQR